LPFPGTLRWMISVLALGPHCGCARYVECLRTSERDEVAGTKRSARSTGEAESNAGVRGHSMAKNTIGPSEGGKAKVCVSVQAHPSVTALQNVRRLWTLCCRDVGPRARKRCSNRPLSHLASTFQISLVRANIHMELREFASRRKVRQRLHRCSSSQGSGLRLRPTCAKVSRAFVDLVITRFGLPQNHEHVHVSPKAMRPRKHVGVSNKVLVSILLSSRHDILLLLINSPSSF